LNQAAAEATLLSEVEVASLPEPLEVSGVLTNHYKFRTESETHCAKIRARGSLQEILAACRNFPHNLET